MTNQIHNLIGYINFRWEMKILLKLLYFIIYLIITIRRKRSKSHNHLIYYYTQCPPVHQPERQLRGRALRRRLPQGAERGAPQRGPLAGRVPLVSRTCGLAPEPWPHLSGRPYRRPRSDNQGSRGGGNGRWP